MTPGDTSEVIDTTGFDYLIYHVGAGQLPASDTITFGLRGTSDSAGATGTGSIATEVSIHAPASAGAGVTSRVTGYLSKLPRYLVVVASGGGGSPELDLWVELRKTNVFMRGR